MNEARTRSLMHSGVSALKAGQVDLAHSYFERAIFSAQNHDLLADLWFYLSETEKDEGKKRNALEEALSYRMTHSRARRSLAVLNGTLQADEIVDADKIAAPETGDKSVSAERFVCPNCGGRMSFSPDGQTLVCDFCAVRQANSAAKGEVREQDFFSAMATLRGHSKPVARQIFHCQGCGAEFLLPPNEISARCAYCASPHVVCLEETRELLEPDAIIPHAFERRQAKRILIGWMKEQAITPQKKVLPPRGFYIPVWTFDLSGEIAYRGDEVVNDNAFSAFGMGRGGRKVTRKVSDTYPVYVDDLLVPAAQNILKGLPELLESYDLNQAESYKPHYLAAWLAESYALSLADASLQARSKAFEEHKRRLRVRLDRLENLRFFSANLSVTSYKLLLLPVWTTKYMHKDREYTFLINGQNGQVVSKAPRETIRGWLEKIF